VFSWPESSSLLSVVKERAGTAKDSTAGSGSGSGSRGVSVGEQLLEYGVTQRGLMVAVYNSTRQSCVIKIKNVASRLSDDWHFLLRSDVSDALLSSIV